MSDVQNIKIRLVGEADLSQLDTQLNKITKSEATLKDQLKSVDTQAKATNKTMQDEAQKSAKAVDDSSKSFDGLKDKVKGLASTIPGAFQVEQVLGFSKALTSTSASTGGVSAAMNVLKVAFASTGIGLLVVALVSLVAYFKSTDDGATKLEGVMGGLGAAFGEVVGYAAELGSKIFAAFESVDNFKQGLSDLGEFLLNNLFNRFKAFLVYGEAIGLLFSGEFKAAMLKGADASIQLTTGVTDATSKISKLSDEVAAAAAQAYAFAVKMDAVNDATRENSILIEKNEKAIGQLLIASKNRTISAGESIAMLDKASKLEQANFNLTYENEKKRLVLIQENEAREVAAINKVNAAKLAEAKTDQERTDILKKQLSVSDEIRQKTVDQINKITKIEEESTLLNEKIANRRDARVQQAISDRLALIKLAGTAEENIYKEQYAARLIDEKQLNKGIEDSQLDSLYTQRAYMVELGRDTVDIDKSINDILIKQRKDLDASLLDADKKLHAEEDEENKANIERMKNDADYYKQKEKEKTDAAKAEVAKRQQIQQMSFQLLTSLATGFFALETEQRNQKLSSLESQKNQELALAGENKNAQSAINAKFAKQEAEIKRKQAVADKEQAVFNIALSTAAAIIKQLAATPLPIGAPLVALIAATGAIQLAFAAAKPIPKFNRGTKSVPGVDTGGDSVYAMLRPGEGIMPVDKMNEYRPAFEAMYDGRIPADAINSLVLNYNKGIPSGVSDTGLKSEIRELGKKLDKIKTFEVTMDAKGFKSYLKSESSKTELENNYLRIQ